MVGHMGSSAGSYLADPTSPIPSHCASIVATSTVRVSIHISTVLYTRMLLSNNAFDVSAESTELISNYNVGVVFCISLIMTRRDTWL